MLAYITSLYSVRDGYIDQLYDEFKKLIKYAEGQPIYVWTDRTIPFELPANVECIDAPLASFTSYIDCIRAEPPMQLPKTRNPAKDTLEFMALMNSKVEMVWRTIPLLPEGIDAVAWIDAGICKIFKEGEDARVAAAFDRLRTWIPHTLVMPGCWPEWPVSEDSVCWRFCGGFFALPTGLVEHFHTANRTILEKWIARGRIAWEVNIWADMECSKIGPKIVWFQGDHDIRMIEGIFQT
jgi:hypothetical protein